MAPKRKHHSAAATSHAQAVVKPSPSTIPHSSSSTATITGDHGASARRPDLTIDTQHNARAAVSGADAAGPPSALAQSVLTDPWTDEQEIALLKAIVRWKPVGMHRHFRMISILNYLAQQPCVRAEDEHCLSAKGVWEKLGALYNLEVLDEREDSNLASPPQSPDSEVRPRSLESNSTFQIFSLPQEFDDMMFERRIAPEGSKSPPLSTGWSGRGGSTMRASEELRSSPMAGIVPRGRKRGRRSTKEAVQDPAEDDNGDSTRQNDPADQRDSIKKAEEISGTALRGRGISPEDPSDVETEDNGQAEGGANEGEIDGKSKRSKQSTSHPLATRNRSNAGGGAGTRTKSTPNRAGRGAGRR